MIFLYNEIFLSRYKKWKLLWKVCLFLGEQKLKKTEEI